MKNEDVLKWLTEIYNLKSNNMDADFRSTLHDVLDSVEKQIAKTPKRNVDSETSNVCPICNSIVNKFERYCNNCGQKLDWNNFEKRKQFDNLKITHGSVVIHNIDDDEILIDDIVCEPIDMAESIFIIKK